MTGRTVSHYQILEQLGEGGMGVVYKAVDTRLDRTVALKFLPARLSKDDSANERFVQEAKAASALDDAHICTIFDIGESEEGELYIVMAYYDGQTLKYRLKDGPLPIEEAADIASQIAEGLARAHEAGIVHRDVKPANIMVTDRGQAKILDFGVAKLEGSRSDLTQTGSTLGTAGYMSPEQVRGEVVDLRSDLWALGVVLYEMLSGQRPFVGDYDAAVAYAILNEQPAVVDGVPQGLLDVVMRLLAKEPGDRYQSAEEVAVALAEYRPVGLTSGSRVAAAPVAVAAARWKTPAWVVAGLMAVIAIGFGVTRLGSMAGDPASAERGVSPNVIAVMPFEIRGGQDLQYLGEGLVNLLSTKLDGAGALRTVDPRALLAHIGNRIPGGLDPTSAADVARHFGAGRFVMGSLVAVGEQMELSASSYDVDSSQPTGEAAVAAQESTLLDAIDGLSARLLGTIGAGGGERVRKLASVTTSSLPALKAYLEGERLIRAGSFPEATVALEEAVREDSLFALAYYRLSIAGEWGNTTDIYEPAQKALSLADRLPDRERQLLTAFFIWRNGRVLEAEQRFRAYLGQYPKDVEALWQLGETLFHGAPMKGRLASESRGLFEQVLELEPNNYPAVIHLARLAASEGRLDDLREYYELVKESDDRFRLEVGSMLAFGGGLAAMQDSMLAGLRAATDNVAMYAVQGVGLYGRDPTAGEKLARVVAESDRGTLIRAYEFTVMASYAAGRGRFADARRFSDEAETLMPSVVHLSPFLGTPTVVPTADLTVLTEKLEALGDQVPGALVDLLGDDAVPAGRAERIYLRAALAARVGEAEEARRLVNRFRELPVMDESGSFFDDVPMRIEAEIALYDGRLTEALSILESLTMDTSVHFAQMATHALATIDRFNRAELLFRSGRYEEAIGWYESMSWLNQVEAVYIGPSYHRLAQSYDELGQTDRAIEYYTRFVDMWSECDPEYKPLVEEARDRLDVLLRNSSREPATAVPS